MPTVFRTVTASALPWNGTPGVAIPGAFQVRVSLVTLVAPVAGNRCAAFRFDHGGREESPFRGGEEREHEGRHPAPAGPRTRRSPTRLLTIARNTGTAASLTDTAPALDWHK